MTLSDSMERAAPREAIAVASEPSALLGAHFLTAVRRPFGLLRNTCHSLLVVAGKQKQASSVAALFPLRCLPCAVEDTVSPKNLDTRWPALVVLMALLGLLVGLLPDHKSYALQHYRIASAIL